VRLTLKVVMQTDGGVVDVIVLHSYDCHNNFKLKFRRPSINAARITEVILGSYSEKKLAITWVCWSVRVHTIILNNMKLYEKEISILIVTADPGLFIGISHLVYVHFTL